MANGRLRRRFAAALLAAALLSPLASCGVVPSLVGGPSPAPGTPSQTAPDGGGETNGPSGEASDYTATCTGEGRLQTYGSTRPTDHDTTNAQGESFTYAPVLVSLDDAGDPIAVLVLQVPPAPPENLPRLRVGEEVTFDDWTITMRSICADSIGFDAEMTA